RDRLEGLNQTEDRTEETHQGRHVSDSRKIRSALGDLLTFLGDGDTQTLLERLIGKVRAQERRLGDACDGLLDILIAKRDSLRDLVAAHEFFDLLHEAARVFQRIDLHQRARALDDNSETEECGGNDRTGVQKMLLDERKN